MPQDNRDNRKDETEELRAEAAALLEQACKQLAEVQKALSSLGGDRAAHARLSAAADRLSAIVSELSQAVNSRAFPLRGSDLAAIGSAVQAGEARAALGEAAAPTAGVASAEAAAAVTTAAAETRGETESLVRDVFDRHVFDPYLHYSSLQDEEESRQRLAADKRYIADQLARHTSEGDLNASGGMIDSMLDLHAHGAGNSPEFMPRMNALIDKAGRQRAAMRAAGQSTAEYDAHVDAGVRHYLKAKNLPDSEIDARLKASANPLDAVRPFLSDDRDGRNLERQTRISGHAANAAATPLARAEPAAGGSHPTTPAPVTLDAISAKLKAAGVKLSDNGDVKPAHGVNLQKAQTKDVLALG